MINIFGATQSTHKVTFIIHNQVMKQVTPFKYLGVYSDGDLFWSSHVDYMLQSATEDVFPAEEFQRSFGSSKEILTLLCCFTIQSILQHSCTLWFNKLTVQLRARFISLLGLCSKLVGHPQDTILASCKKSTLRLTTFPWTDVLHGVYKLLPSGRHFKVFNYRII